MWNKVQLLGVNTTDGPVLRIAPTFGHLVVSCRLSMLLIIYIFGQWNCARSPSKYIAETLKMRAKALPTQKMKTSLRLKLLIYATKAVSLVSRVILIINGTVLNQILTPSHEGGVAKIEFPFNIFDDCPWEVGDELVDQCR